MGKKGTRRERVARDKHVIQIREDEPNERVISACKKPLQPQNEAQRRYANAITANTLTFSVGPAGTGKTYVCAALAAQALSDKETDRVIVTRPAVEAGEGSLGYLPGELEEKYAPYFQPFRDVLNRRLGSGPTEYMIKTKKIEALPLNFMRGMTFEDCWVILDEAQNTTPKEMLLFLTRIGKNCKVIVNGDLSQKDIEGKSGLEDAMSRLRGVKGIDAVFFTEADIVRSGLVRVIIERYSSKSESADEGEGPEPWRNWT